MNFYFVTSAATTFIVGLIHSILGEQLVFQRMRMQGIIPVNGGHLLHESSVRILWASWHIVTVLGWCIAAALCWLADPSKAPLAQSGLSKAIVTALLSSSALVLAGTRGRHLGWVGLLAAAMFALAGMYAS